MYEQPVQTPFDKKAAPKSPATPPAQSLGFMLLEEWDRRLLVYGLENAVNWMRKLDNDQFGKLIEAMRFGRRPH